MYELKYYLLKHDKKFTNFRHGACLFQVKVNCEKNSTIFIICDQISRVINK